MLKIKEHSTSCCLLIEADNRWGCILPPVLLGNHGTMFWEQSLTLQSLFFSRMELSSLSVPKKACLSIKKQGWESSTLPIIFGNQLHVTFTLMFSSPVAFIISLQYMPRAFKRCRTSFHFGFGGPQILFYAPSSFCDCSPLPLKLHNRLF